MDISLYKNHSWIVIDVKGRLDSFNYDFISTKLQLLDQVGKKFVAVDLSSCLFLNMQAARLIATTCKTYRNEGGSFAVIGDNENFKKRINIFLKEELNFYSSQEKLPKNLEVKSDA